MSRAGRDTTQKEGRQAGGHVLRRPTWHPGLHPGSDVGAFRIGLQPRCVHGGQELDHLLHHLSAHAQPCTVLSFTSPIKNFQETLSGAKIGYECSRFVVNYECVFFRCESRASETCMSAIVNTGLLVNALTH